LAGFSRQSLVELRRKVRDFNAVVADPRVPRVADDAYIADLADAVAGRLVAAWEWHRACS
jgi:hypothetical protein